MAKIYALANQKGGVMKTSSAVALGHGLALDGYRVLIVDLDPQGHVAVALGLEKASGVYRLINEQAPLPDVIVNARPRLDIVPSDKRTELAKHHVVIMPYREGVLVEALGDYTADYDFVLLDLNKEWEIKDKNIVSKCGWSPFNGLKVKGKVESTFVRGQQVYDGEDALEAEGKEVSFT